MKRLIKKILFSVLYALDSIFFSSQLFAHVASRYLFQHYRSINRKSWKWGIEKSMHFDQRETFFKVFHPAEELDIILIARGLWVREILKTTDNVLDIGCGEGFYTAKFYSPACQSVLAIDIDKKVIQKARNVHSRKNVTYEVANIFDLNLRQTFDVIVWNAVYGGFSKEEFLTAVQNLKSLLTQDGVFFGSSAMGSHGIGLDNEFEFIGGLKKKFDYVEFRKVDVQISGGIRQEIYWRCSRSGESLQRSSWLDSSQADFS